MRRLAQVLSVGLFLVAALPATAVDCWNCIRPSQECVSSGGALGHTICRNYEFGCSEEGSQCGAPTFCDPEYFCW